MTRGRTRVAMLIGAMLVGAALVPPPGVDAGGVRGVPPGLSIHGRISNGRATASTGAVAAGALMVGAGAMDSSGEGWRDDPALFTVDAAPADALVYLDGRFLGVAGELIARALPVAFGPHLIQVVAPGFHPWAERFFADGSFPTRIRATLARQ
jgi:hypothetical protein